MGDIIRHTLEVDSVEVSFGERSILSGVYLRVETGSVTALVGRNGCGKSTLMKVLCGALRPTMKSMRIDDVWFDRFSCQQVKYLLQEHFIPDRLPVEQVLRDFGLTMAELLVWFPCFERLAGAKVGQMSGGERRLLECYVVLRGEAMFVMLDEPFAQIAPLHVETLKRLIRAEVPNKGILITDHLYRHVQDVADQLYLIADGHTRLLKEPKELVRYGYLSSHNADF